MEEHQAMANRIDGKAEVVVADGASDQSAYVV